MSSKPQKSDAFLKKCAKEKEKLMKHLAKQLEEDMQRLYVEALDGLQNGGESLRPHKYILKARCPVLYKALEKFLRQPVTIPKEVMKDYITVLEHLYTKENIAIVSFQIDRLVQFFNDPENRELPTDENLVSEIIAENEFESNWESNSQLNQEQLNIDLNDKLITGCENDKINHDFLMSTHSLKNTNHEGFSESNPNIQKLDSNESSEAGLNGCVDTDGGCIDTALSKKDLDMNQRVTDKNNEKARNKIEQNGDLNDKDTTANTAEDITAGNVGDEATLEEPLTESVSILGSDLLYIYQTGADIDAVLVAQETKYFAHRGILSVRSDYFAAMLGGGWAESSAEEIKLEGVRAEVLEKMLFYIYGGYVEDWSLELLAAGDMYGMVGLKQCMEYALRKNKCHFFHKPCSDCLSEFSDALAVSHMYGLEDIFQRCLSWSTKYFDRLWQVKSFAQLPQELLDKCLDSLLKELSFLNIIQIYLDAVKLIKALQNLKWGESVVALATNLIDGCVKFTSKNVMSVVNCQKKSISLAYEGMAEDSIDELFGRAIKLQRPEVGIRTYSELEKICTELGESSEPQAWHNQYQIILPHAKQYMTTNINAVVSLPEWGMKLSQKQQESLKKGEY